MALCFFLFAAVPADAPIADASMRNDAAQVRLLVANGAEVNAAHGDGMTGLHWAAENGNPEIRHLGVDTRPRRLQGYSKKEPASSDGYALGGPQHRS